MAAPPPSMIKAASIRCFRCWRRKRSRGWRPVRRGALLSGRDGDLKAGETAPGLMFILKGRIAVTQGGEFGRHEAIVEHGPGGFLGELAQLSGRPALVDAIAARRCRSHRDRRPGAARVMMQEAELGERIMRALILRRVGIARTGESGPIIIGRRDISDVLRLENFLARNGHPHKMPGFGPIRCAKTLIERFQVAPERIADRALSGRPAVAQSQREPIGALHRPVARHQSAIGL